ncbi:MAG: hypothetical protein ABIK89_03435 [Planctomycetota bacterium]
MADRLRREAAACRPGFSESLHRQVCRAVRRCEATKASADSVPASGWLLRHGVATAIVTVGVLAATVIAWQAMTDDGAPRRAVNPSLAGSVAPVRPPTLSTPEGAHVATDTPTELEMVGALAGRATEEIGILVESTVTERHWTYLDQNAKLAFEALNNRVPLDAVASLIFADASTDSAGGNIDSAELPW